MTGWTTTTSRLSDAADELDLSSHATTAATARRTRRRGSYGRDDLFIRSRPRPRSRQRAVPAGPASGSGRIRAGASPGRHFGTGLRLIPSCTTRSTPSITSSTTARADTSSAPSSSRTQPTRRWRQRADSLFPTEGRAENASSVREARPARGPRRSAPNARDGRGGTGLTGHRTHSYRGVREERESPGRPRHRPPARRAMAGAWLLELGRCRRGAGRSVRRRA
jgi:hypothetical protein